jgi:G3E family GTPase
MGAHHVLEDDDVALAALVGMAGRARFALPAAQVQTSDRFTTCDWQSDRAVRMQDFRAAMNRIAPHVLRAKGFINFVEKPGQSFLFQLAGRRITMTPHPTAQQGCALVLIGEAGPMRAIDVAAILDDAA